MQNHTNAVVTIHQQIAEKFVGSAQKILTDDVVKEVRVEKAALKQPHIPKDKVIFFHHDL